MWSKKYVKEPSTTTPLNRSTIAPLKAPSRAPIMASYSVDSPSPTLFAAHMTRGYRLTQSGTLEEVTPMLSGSSSLSLEGSSGALITTNAKGKTSVITLNTAVTYHTPMGRIGHPTTLKLRSTPPAHGV